MRETAENGGSLCAVEAIAWGATMTAGTPLVRSICEAMGWAEVTRSDCHREGGPLPTSAPPKLFLALSKSLEAMFRELDGDGPPRDQGALRAQPAVLGAQERPPAPAQTVRASSPPLASGVRAGFLTSPPQPPAVSVQAYPVTTPTTSQASPTACPLVPSVAPPGIASGLGAGVSAPGRLGTDALAAPRFRSPSSSARTILLLLRGRTICEDRALRDLLDEELRISDPMIQSFARNLVGWEAGGPGNMSRDLRVFREVLGAQLTDEMAREVAGCEQGAPATPEMPGGSGQGAG
eukprot:3935574-Rhodomonas_salina.2